MSEDSTFDTIPSAEWELSIQEQSERLQHRTEMSEAVQRVDTLSRSDASRFAGTSQDDFADWIKRLEASLERLRFGARQATG